MKTIPVTLRLYQTQLQASFLDDLLAGRAKPKAHRIENITPADIAKRIGQLMVEAEKAA